MKNTQVARLLAYVTRMVNQRLLLQNEYLIAEKRILRSPQIQRSSTDFTAAAQSEFECVRGAMCTLN